MRGDGLPGATHHSCKSGNHGGRAVSVIFLLIPLSILLAIGVLIAFAWAVTSGQYEDTNTPSMRVVLGEPGMMRVGESDPAAVRPASGSAPADSNFPAAAVGCPSRNSNKP